MATTMQDNRPAVAPLRIGVVVAGDDPLDSPKIEQDPAAVRRRRAIRLVAAVDGKREPLERLRAAYLRRLHSAHDDPAAVEGLRLTEVALSLTTRSEGVLAWQRHECGEKPRWWRRWRSNGRRARPSVAR